tara:strand:- start:5848 stop:6294 length:447 start_codon:yes stop_codon:yes gene_type:complete
MSLFEDIKELSNGKPQSPSWWRSQLFFGLQGRGLDSPLIGAAITFQYDAKFGERMQKWDKYPLVYVTGESTNHFWGSNVHYLQPAARRAGFTPEHPPQTFHKYLRSNVLSPFYNVPESEWDDIGLIPSEQFTVTVNGRNIDIPTRIIF